MALQFCTSASRLDLATSAVLVVSSCKVRCFRSMLLIKFRRGGTTTLFAIAGSDSALFGKGFSFPPYNPPDLVPKTALCAGWKRKTLACFKARDWEEEDSYEVSLFTSVYVIDEDGGSRNFLSPKRLNEELFNPFKYSYLCTGCDF